MNAHDPFAPLSAGEASRGKIKVDEPDDWQPMPVPDDAPAPPSHCGRLRSWSMHFAYRTADGALAGYICRFETATGKETRPLRYGTRNGREGWHWKGWAGDHARPLYRLPELVADPDAPVILCEGEKSADAAAAVLGQPWVATASMNGARSPHLADWAPLAGRDLVIWPDNDEPGRAYALEAAGLALKAGASSVRIVDAPDGLPDGWDLADPVPEGMHVDYANLIAEAPRFDPDGEEQGTFRVQWRRAGDLMPGVHFKTLTKDPDTGEPTPGWHWFGSRLEVLGYTRDDENREWGRYLAVHDQDGKLHYIAMPMSAMAGDGAEYRRELLSNGFILAPGKTSREQLDIYLSMWRPKRRVRCVSRIGWHGARFVLPDRTFGPGGETMILHASRPAKITVAGSLAGWKQDVAAPAVGNSRLAFAISASFTGPLLHLAGQESGGFHFRGGSSIGKTKLLNAAASVWGYDVGHWRTTDNAAEGTAAGSCDTLMTLDELSQAPSRAVDAMAYMLANGSGKARADRTGAAREVVRWRIMLLSTGEVSLADKIAEDHGKQSRAGQSVRVVDIPADAGKRHGAFDTLHGFPDGAALADHLMRSSRAHSGHAARAFLERITEDPSAISEFARGWMAKWLNATVPADADGQVKRVANRFAMVAAAGELATAKGVLPWHVGEATSAAALCFRDWLVARGGSGAEEITSGIRQVRKFLELHGSSRFEAAWEQRATFPEGHAVLEKVINRAGFRKLEGNGADAVWEFYILPEAWRGEVCRGLDATAIAKHMEAEGWLIAGDSRHIAYKMRAPGHGTIRAIRVAASFMAEDGQ